jgi:hypothetical protein
MDIIALDSVFTTAGAAAWAATVIAVVELLKRLSPLAEYGRAPMYAAAALSAFIVGLAAWSAVTTEHPVYANSDLPNFGVLLILTWATVTTAAIGTYATAAKAGSVLQGRTNPAGPDEAAAPPPEDVAGAVG